VELKTAIKNLQKDRYVSSMLREELETVVSALDRLQASKEPEVPVAAIAEKLGEALAMLKGDRAPANSKSTPKGAGKAPSKGRAADRGGARETVAVAAKA